MQHYHTGILTFQKWNQTGTRHKACHIPAKEGAHTVRPPANPQTSTARQDALKCEEGNTHCLDHKPDCDVLPVKRGQRFQAECDARDGNECHDEDCDKPCLPYHNRSRDCGKTVRTNAAALQPPTACDDAGSSTRDHSFWRKVFFTFSGVWTIGPMSAFLSFWNTDERRRFRTTDAPEERRRFRLVGVRPSPDVGVNPDEPRRPVVVVSMAGGADSNGASAPPAPAFTATPKPRVPGSGCSFSSCSSEARRSLTPLPAAAGASTWLPIFTDASTFAEALGETLMLRYGRPNARPSASAVERGRHSRPTHRWRCSRPRHRLLAVTWLVSPETTGRDCGSGRGGKLSRSTSSGQLLSAVVCNALKDVNRSSHCHVLYILLAGICFAPCILAVAAVRLKRPVSNSTNAQAVPPGGVGL